MSEYTRRPVPLSRLGRAVRTAGGPGSPPPQHREEHRQANWLLERVVETITANREAWLATMMDEELHLQPVAAPDILRSAVVITIATLIGHLIPLLPFVWLSRSALAPPRLDS